MQYSYLLVIIPTCRTRERIIWLKILLLLQAILARTPELHTNESQESCHSAHSPMQAGYLSVQVLETGSS